MLSKINRVRKIYEFNYLYKNGIRLREKNLVLIYHTNKKNITKAGFVISKKIGKANIRNLVKRRLRQIFHDLLNKIEHQSYIFIAQPDIDKLSYEELKKQVETLLSEFIK